MTTLQPGAPMLAAEGVSLSYGKHVIVRDASLSILGKNDTVGVIGESGCGKSTIAKALLGLIKPTDGQVLFRGKSLARLSRQERREYRRTLQPVMQQSSALDPRMTVRASLLEALSMAAQKRNRADSIERAVELLEAVGLAEHHLDRRPHEMSGGQRQRVTIARALAVDPEVLLLDEPTSALDVTVQARILALLRELHTTAGIGYLLIAHNLAVVQELCQTTLVIFGGRIVESGPTSELMRNPAHPYTALLKSAVPAVGIEPAVSAVPSDPNLPDHGCPFQIRCPWVTEVCRVEMPPLVGTGEHKVACHHSDL
jgi:peptide/nickel transport system ATP-binding protein